MKKDKVNNILKGAFAAGAVFGGSAMISDVDMVYAAEFENSDEIGEAIIEEEAPDELEEDNSIEKEELEESDNQEDLEDDDSKENLEDSGHEEESEDSASGEDGSETSGTEEEGGGRLKRRWSRKS